MRKNPQGLDANRVRKNRDILHSEAVRWIKKASQATFNGKTGYPEASFFLADCYGNGTLGLTVDHDRAFGYYVQGAKQDHPASIYRTGVCYEVGAGTKRDHLRAVQYYKKAAALGDTAAMYKIGMILMNGTLSQQRNPREGVNYLKRAANQADETTPYALHELATLYEGINLDPSIGVVPVRCFHLGSNLCF
jgi:TPR repeat protein